MESNFKREEEALDPGGPLGQAKPSAHRVVLSLCHSLEGDLPLPSLAGLCARVFTCRVRLKFGVSLLAAWWSGCCRTCVGSEQSSVL